MLSLWWLQAGPNGWCWWAKVVVADFNLYSYEEFEAEAKDMTAEGTVAKIEAWAVPLEVSR
jgi:hypothetical protein